MDSLAAGATVMENDNSTDHRSWRSEAELADLIAAYVPHFDSLEENLYQIVQRTGVPANTTRARVMRFYSLLKIIKIGGQDMDPKFRLASALITVALGGVKCSLLMYVMLDDMPWPIVVLGVLMAFAFIARGW